MHISCFGFFLMYWLMHLFENQMIVYTNYTDLRNLKNKMIFLTTIMIK